MRYFNRRNEKVKANLVYTKSDVAKMIADMVMRNRTCPPVHVSYSDTFNMAVPLSEWIIQEEQSVTRVLWSEDMESNDM
jgi:hypothetical protein